MPMSARYPNVDYAPAGSEPDDGDSIYDVPKLAAKKTSPKPG